MGITRQESGHRIFFLFLQITSLDGSSLRIVALTSRGNVYILSLFQTSTVLSTYISTFVPLETYYTISSRTYVTVRYTVLSRMVILCMNRFINSVCNTNTIGSLGSSLALLDADGQLWVDVAAALTPSLQTLTSRCAGSGVCSQVYKYLQ